MVELCGFREDGYLFQPLFTRERGDMGNHSEPKGLQAVGSLSQKEKLIAEGILDEYEKAMEDFRRLEDQGVDSGRR